MSRRIGRSRRLTVAPRVSFSTILALASGKFAFTADRYTPAASNAGDFVDWLDGSHKIVQATGGSQVAAPTTHSDFAGNLCATFTGAQYYVSNRAASAFKFMHDGTGCEVLLVYTLTNGATTARMVSTQTTTTVGMRLHTSGANGRAYVHNGTIGIIDQTAAIAAGTPTYLMHSYSESQSPKSVLRLKSSTAASGAPSGAPSVSDPTSTLALGGSAAGIELAQMRWAALIAFSPLDASSRNIVQRWVRQTYSIQP